MFQAAVRAHSVRGFDDRRSVGIGRVLSGGNAPATAGASRTGAQKRDVSRSPSRSTSQRSDVSALPTPGTALRKPRPWTALSAPMRRAIARKMSPSQIRKIRKAIGFSQEQLARLLWVTYSTINRWEAGRAAPFGLHLRILLLLKEKISNPAFRATLRDPRSADPSFLLYRLLDFSYADRSSRRSFPAKAKPRRRG
jgi:transcriptional regulator with XRE-family HTH domain